MLQLANVFISLFIAENAMLFCFGSSPTAVLAFGQLSSISMSLHEFISFFSFYNLQSGVWSQL